MRTTKKWSKMLLAGMFNVVLAFSFTGCAHIPYTGQISFSDAEEKKAASTYYTQFIRYSETVKNTADAQMVQDVSNRIIEAAKKWAKVNNASWYLKNYNWDVTLIRSNEANAWCMPGGKIVVFTGLLPVTRSADGLAAVLGHEVAHALLIHGYRGQHAADVAVTWVSRKTRSTLPYGRGMETEADKVGLTLMVLAGYDGNEAAAVWQRMTQLYGDNSSTEFLSTHPSHSRRIKNLQNELRVSQRIAKKINSGKKAQQFVEKTLSFGAAATSGIVGSSNQRSDFKSAMGAFFFLDATYLELKLTVPVSDSSNLLGSAYFKWPFPLGTSGTFVWFPLYGIDFGNHYVTQNLGLGADLNITDRLFLRGAIGLRMNHDSDFSKKSSLHNRLAIIPVSIGVGYAVK
ncbi:MAG: hypothetical protein Ta2A_18810 [Treponemataceae bacterium]|nr:MAG: hypothetical protein Ta2A_18810 [Treponemataceae bacterium]